MEEKNNVIETRDAIKTRQAKDKESLLAHLREVPIITYACKKSGISRATYYRFKNEDKEFAHMADEAIEEGTAYINDLSESQLIQLINERKLPAIALWLKAHHPKYTQKVEHSGRVIVVDDLYDYKPEQSEED